MQNRFFLKEPSQRCLSCWIWSLGSTSGGRPTRVTPGGTPRRVIPLWLGSDHTKPPWCGQLALGPLLRSKLSNAIVSLGISTHPLPDPSQMSSSLTPNATAPYVAFSILLPRKCSKAYLYQACLLMFLLGERPVSGRLLPSYPQLLQMKPTVNPSPDISWKWLISQINRMGSNIKIFLKNSRVVIEWQI